MGTWRLSRAVTLAIVLLLITVLWRLPASWAAHALPEGNRCVDPEGTLWEGGCGRLQTRQFYLEDVHWKLAFAQCLFGRLGGDVHVNDPRLSASGRVSWALNGRWRLEDLKADAEVSRRNVPQLRMEWAARLQLAIRHFEGARGELPAITGTARVLQAHRETAPEQDFGSYELAVDQATPGAARLDATVRDLSGPLALRDTHLTVTAQGEYELNGKVSARPQASEALKQQLEFLGPPDSSGGRPLSVAGAL